jgi:hypothetical protein
LLSFFVTGADTARAAGIPPSANFFSFSYPCEHTRQHLSHLVHQLNGTPWAEYLKCVGGHWNDKDPFVLFLCNGGFVYFDHRYAICGIQAVTFDSSKEAHTHLHATSSSSAVFFAQPSVISEKVFQYLTLCGRWWPVTVDEVARTYPDFAWIGPCEFVGDTIFTRWGGFAYRPVVAHDNTRRTCVYCPVYINEKPFDYIGETDSVAVAEARINLRDSEGRRRDMIPLKCDGTIHMPAEVLQQPETLRGSDFVEYDGRVRQTPLGSSVSF